MRLSAAALAALFCAEAQAFSNTSPFLMFSTAKYVALHPILHPHCHPPHRRRR